MIAIDNQHLLEADGLGLAWMPTVPPRTRYDRYLAQALMQAMGIDAARIDTYARSEIAMVRCNASDAMLAMTGRVEATHEQAWACALALGQAVAKRNDLAAVTLLRSMVPDPYTCVACTCLSLIAAHRAYYALNALMAGPTVHACALAPHIAYHRLPFTEAPLIISGLRDTLIDVFDEPLIYVHEHMRVLTRHNADRTRYEAYVAIDATVGGHPLFAPDQGHTETFVGVARLRGDYMSEDVIAAVTDLLFEPDRSPLHVHQQDKR